MTSYYHIVEFLSYSTKNLFSGTCYGRIKKGWWAGSLIVNEFKTVSELECGRKCCDNKDCKLWVWRTSDKMCHLKKDDHLKWHTASNHFTAKRNDGKT